MPALFIRVETDNIHNSRGSPFKLIQGFNFIILCSIQNLRVAKYMNIFEMHHMSDTSHKHLDLKQKTLHKAGFFAETVCCCYYLSKFILIVLVKSPALITARYLPDARPLALKLTLWNPAAFTSLTKEATS